jgi:hypothetical protein
MGGWSRGVSDSDLWSCFGITSWEKDVLIYPFTEAEGVRRAICDMSLLIFHLVLSAFTFEGVDVRKAARVLEWNLKRYPNGARVFCFGVVCPDMWLYSLFLLPFSSALPVLQLLFNLSSTPNRRFLPIWRRPPRPRPFTTLKSPYLLRTRCSSSNAVQESTPYLVVGECGCLFGALEVGFSFGSGFFARMCVDTNSSDL